MAKRVFTGIFIPAKIWENKKLTPVKKMLLAEISVLSEDTGYCYAGNPHFAEWLECSPQNISKHIRELKDMGAISITFENQITGEGRKMFVKKEFYYGSDPLTTGLAPLTTGLAPLTPGLAEIQFKYNLKKDIYTAPKTENETPAPKSPKVETLDEALKAVFVWLNAGGVETVKVWYDQKMKKYDQKAFVAELERFCSNYLNTSDEGRSQKFKRDPVAFFQNGFRSWLSTSETFNRDKPKPAAQTAQAVYTPPQKRF